LLAAPFRPFRIHLSDGSRFAVHHPDFLAVGDKEIVVTQIADSQGLPQRTATCDPLHVTHVEVTDASG